jgi:hypothetical protein
MPDDDAWTDAPAAASDRPGDHAALLTVFADLIGLAGA